MNHFKRGIGVVALLLGVGIVPALAQTGQLFGEIGMVWRKVQKRHHSAVEVFYIRILLLLAAFGTCRLLFGEGLSSHLQTF